jgi:DNA-binding XRE family transcriptional regulator
MTTTIYFTLPILGIKTLLIIFSEMDKNGIDFPVMGKYNKNKNFPNWEKERGETMPTNIKKLREAKGLQQKEMALMLGYKSIAKYNEIENGNRPLPVKKALLAAEILGCSLDEIFLPSNFPKRTK